jgi:hypothetical protein
MMLHKGHSHEVDALDRPGESRPVTSLRRNNMMLTQ